MMGNSNFGWLPAKELKRYFGNNPKCRLTNHHSRHMARLWHFFTGKWVFWRYWFGLNPSGLAQSKTVLEFVFQKWANFSSSLDGKKKKWNPSLKWKKFIQRKDFHSDLIENIFLFFIIEVHKIWILICLFQHYYLISLHFSSKIDMYIFLFFLSLFSSLLY